MVHLSRTKKGKKISLRYFMFRGSYADFVGIRGTLKKYLTFIHNWRQQKCKVSANEVDLFQLEHSALHGKMWISYFKVCEQLKREKSAIFRVLFTWFSNDPKCLIGMWCLLLLKSQKFWKYFVFQIKIIRRTSVIEMFQGANTCDLSEIEITTLETENVGKRKLDRSRTFILVSAIWYKLVTTVNIPFITSKCSFQDDS